MSNVTPTNPQMLKSVLKAGKGRSIMEVEEEIKKRVEEERKRQRAIAGKVENYVLHPSGFRIYK